MLHPKQDKALTGYEYAINSQEFQHNDDDDDRPSLIMVNERNSSEREQFDLQAETDQTSLLSAEAHGGSRMKESRLTLPHLDPIHVTVDSIKLNVNSPQKSFMSPVASKPRPSNRFTVGNIFLQSLSPKWDSGALSLSDRRLSTKVQRETKHSKLQPRNSNPNAFAQVKLSDLASAGSSEQLTSLLGDRVAANKIQLVKRTIKPSFIQQSHMHQPHEGFEASQRLAEQLQSMQSLKKKDLHVAQNRYGIKRRHYSVSTNKPHKIRLEAQQELASGFTQLTMTRQRKLGHSDHSRSYANNQSIHQEKSMPVIREQNELLGLPQYDGMESRISSQKVSKETKRQDVSIVHEQLVEMQAYTQDIWSDQERKKAGQIYAKRLDSYIQQRRQFGSNGLEMGQMHAQLIRDSSGATLRKKGSVADTPQAIINQYPAPKLTQRQEQPQQSTKVLVPGSLNKLTPLLDDQRIFGDLDMNDLHTDQSYDRLPQLSSADRLGTESAVFVSDSQMNVVHTSPQTSRQAKAKVIGGLSSVSISMNSIDNLTTTLPPLTNSQEYLPSLEEEHSPERHEQMEQYITNIQSQISLQSSALKSQLSSQMKAVKARRDGKFCRNRQIHSYIPNLTKINRSIERETTEQSQIQLKEQPAQSSDHKPLELTKRLSLLNRSPTLKTSKGNSNKFTTPMQSRLGSGLLKQSDQSSGDESPQNNNKQLALAHHKFKDNQQSQSELIKLQLKEGIEPVVKLGDNPVSHNRKKIKRFVDSNPKESVKVLGRDQSQAELRQFRDFFESIAKNLIYKRQVGQFKQYMEGQTQKRIDEMEEAKYLSENLMMILKKDDKVSDQVVQLAYLANERSASRVAVEKQFEDLVRYIQTLSGFESFEKAATYLKHLMTETNVLQLGDDQIKTKHVGIPRSKDDSKKSEQSLKLERGNSCLQLFDPNIDSADEESDEESEYEKTPQNMLSVSRTNDQFGTVSKEIQASISSKLIQKLETNQIMKRDMNTVANQEMRQDAKFHYLKELKVLHTTVKPVLDPKYSTLNELNLSSMMLSSSQVKAISASVAHLPNLSALCVDNTNLQDSDLSLLLKTIIKYIPCFRSITIRGTSNHIGQGSIRQLATLLRRPIPNQLRQLEIVNPLLKSVDTQDLLNAITCSHSLLQRLSLSKVMMQQTQVIQLSSFINENLQLTDLSLNQLRLSAQNFSHILKAIAKNRKLRQLSLQNNALVDQMYVKEKAQEEEYYYDEEEPESVERQKDGEMAESILKQQNSIRDIDTVPQKKVKQSQKNQMEVLKVDQEFVLATLKELIELNQSLQHVDLISTGLNQSSILEIAQILKDNQTSELKVRNIVSIHFSFPNPFDKQTILKKIKQIISCRPDSNAIKIQCQEDDTVGQWDLAGSESQSLEESFCIQREISKSLDLINAKPPSKPTNWHLNVGKQEQNCWICSKAKFTLIFVKLNSTQTLDDNIFVQFESHGKLSASPLQQDQSYRMMAIADYCRALDVHYIKHFDFFGHFKRNGQLQTEMKTEMDLVGVEKKEYKQLCREYKDNLYKNQWRKIISRHMDYSEVQPIGDHNEEVDQTKKEVLLVTCLMLRPGKHSYRVVDGQGTVVKQMTEVFVSESRQEELPFFKSAYQIQTKFDTFSIPRSLFKDWKGDDKQSICFGLEMDTKSWQLSKVIKNEIDLRSVITVLRSNAKFINDLFTSLVSQDPKYPKLSFDLFVDFCKSVCIIENASAKYPQALISKVDWILAKTDNFNADYGSGSPGGQSPARLSRKATKLGRPQYANFNRSQAAMCFANSIFQPSQLVKAEEAPLHLYDERERRQYVVNTQVHFLDNSSSLAVMSRAQFLECLVRIAIDKYLDTGVELNVLRATQKLIEDELQRRVKVSGPEIFRKKCIQTKEIHQLFKANQLGLKKLYKFFKDRRTGAINFETATKTMMHELFNMPIERARLIFARSKMLVTNEMSQKANYDKLEYVEFLELICRIAKDKFDSCQEGKNDQTFPKQVAMILEECLSQIRVPLVDPSIHSFADGSDSDSDSKQSETESVSNSVSNLLLDQVKSSLSIRTAASKSSFKSQSKSKRMLTQRK